MPSPPEGRGPAGRPPAPGGSTERFDRYVDRCLYDAAHGFFATTGSAGGARGDFVTSPEIGPLFGEVIARMLDARWREAGAPDDFTLLEAGAGRGALVRSVVSAEPECRHALRIVTVERSERLRSEQLDVLGVTPVAGDGPGRGVTSDAVLGTVRSGDAQVPVEVRAALPSRTFDGVVVANELIDNLAVRMVERTDAGWGEVAVRTDGDGVRTTTVAPAADPVEGDIARVLPEDCPSGVRLPVCEQARAWVGDVLRLVGRGRVVVIDYGVASTAELVGRDWLRTYRRHVRGADPLAEPGRFDITVDVPFDQLPAGCDVSTQADFLRRWGIEELVDEGRGIWAARAHLGDLAAIRGRSRIAEAAALCDPTGLGRFVVAEWPPASTATRQGDASVRPASA